jgi:Fe-S-cluster containining protein
LRKYVEGKTGGGTMMKTKIDREVKQVYDWLDFALEGNRSTDQECTTCGKCCNFKQFGHRLFVTSPELLYLSENLLAEKLKHMDTNTCPYNIEGRCSIYNFRFAGCRIFFCGGPANFQSEISEITLNKFKRICEEFDIQYRYADIKDALNGFEYQKLSTG